jgi:hypothetical protein
MELYLPRLAIRQQVLVLTGYSADALLSAQEAGVLNARIDLAALRVAGKNRWLTLQRQVSVPIDTDHPIISYRFLEQAYWLEANFPGQYHPGTYDTPADTFAPNLALAPINNVGPAGILDLVYWDADKGEYKPMIRATEALRFSQDRWADAPAEAQLNSVYAADPAATTTAKVAAAEGLREAQRARPYSYEARQDGIHIWPLPDKRYVIRSAYTISPTWAYPGQGPNTVTNIDQVVSVVDAMAIIYYAAAASFRHQGDKDQAAAYEAMADERIRELRAFQSTSESVVADTEAAFDNDYEQNNRGLPRWNLGPFQRG